MSFSLAALSEKPWIKMRLHPAYSFVPNERTGRYESHSEYKQAQPMLYRVDDFADKTIIRGLQQGVSVADLRGRLREKLSLTETANAMATIYPFFRYGLLVFEFADNAGRAMVILMPDRSDFEIAFAPLDTDENLVMSRFMLLHREDERLLLEAPIMGVTIASDNETGDELMTTLMRVHTITEIEERFDGHAGDSIRDLVSIMKKAGIVVSCTGGIPDRYDESGEAAAQWDVHDLYFHGRSRMGCSLSQGNVFGGVFPNIGRYKHPPAVRPPWPGDRIPLATEDVEKILADESEASLFNAQWRRHSVREYDDDNPVTLEQLGRFLFRSARVVFRQSGVEVRSDLRGVDGTDEVEFAWRPYPAGGASYELEIYMSVDKCRGLASGFYHYDADAHALTQISDRNELVEQMLMEAYMATAAQARPHVVLHIAARFQRVGWKYRNIAYSVVLKNTGVVYQTFYLVATTLGLGPCGLGAGNINNFAKITGLDPMVEGSVGDFALGSLRPDHYNGRHQIFRQVQ